MTEITAYPTKTIEMGLLGKQEVLVYIVPRADFIAAAREALPDDPELAEKVWEIVGKTAETMTTFPFGHWVHPVRGCGCIVGETLVADPDILDRAAFSHVNISKELDARYGEDLGEQLYWYGCNVDETLSALVSDDDDFGTTAILIED